MIVVVTSTIPCLVNSLHLQRFYPFLYPKHNSQLGQPETHVGLPSKGSLSKVGDVGGEYGAHPKLVGY